jgi:hypothetical protein
VVLDKTVVAPMGGQFVVSLSVLGYLVLFALGEVPTGGCLPVHSAASLGTNAVPF